MDDEREPGSESSGGTNTPDFGAIGRAFGRYGRSIIGSSTSGSDVADGTATATLDETRDSDYSVASGDSESHSEPTGSGGSGSSSDSGDTSGSGGLSSFLNRYRTTVGTSNGSSDSEASEPDDAALAVDFGELDIPRKRRGRPVGSKNAPRGAGKTQAAVYRRFSEIIARLPFWGIAMYHRYKAFKLTDEEAERIAIPLSSIAEKYVPVNAANTVVGLSDVLQLVDAVTDIYEAKNAQFRLDQLNAEQRADEFTAGSTNGYSEAAPSRHYAADFGVYRR